MNYSCAVVYLMNLRIPPKPAIKAIKAINAIKAIKAILKLKLDRAYEWSTHYSCIRRKINELNSDKEMNYF
jgi:hypothetical protein